MFCGGLCNFKQFYYLIYMLESLRIGLDIDLYTGPRNDGARILPCRQKAPHHGWFTPMLKVRPSAAEPRVEPPAHLSENRRDLIQFNLTNYLQRSKIYCQIHLLMPRETWPR